MRKFKGTFRVNSAVGFGLLEAVLSLGLISTAIFVFGPLVCLGLQVSHQGRATSTATGLAQAIAFQAIDGTLVPGVTAYDSEGTLLPSTQGAAFRVEVTVGSPGEITASFRNLSCLTIQVIPTATPRRMQSYVFLVPKKARD